MNQNILSNEEIIKKLKIVTGSKTASELARKLDTERQNLKSYEKKKTTDLNTRIISLLMKIIENQDQV
jgi:transcriptional regulator